MRIKTDLPNGYYVSTTRLPIGGRYETMVFPLGKDGRVSSWTDLDCCRYDSELAAERGHEAMVEKWRAKEPPAELAQGS